LIVAGIDYSMTSPALCVYNTETGEFSFDNCTFYFLTQSKKYEIDSENIHGMFFEYDNEMQRYDTISSYFLDRIMENEVDKVYMEDYSMGSKGRVFHIAENTGVLKYRMWSFGIPFQTIPPTVIKKFATGKGNANKERMQEVFEEQNQVRLKQVFNMTDKQWNPSSDLIDAYYICKYGLNDNTLQ
jgi:Holliday junction resolvasome RuvABC endonuclease subunit